MFPHYSWTSSFLASKISSRKRKERGSEASSLSPNKVEIILDDMDEGKPGALTQSRSFNVPSSPANKKSFCYEQVMKLRSIGVQVSHVTTHAGRTDSSTVDRFQIRVPYCTNFLSWDVIYNLSQPSVVPDFILQENEETWIPIENLESLKKWKPENVDSLLDVINEMLNCYKDYQKQLIMNLSDPRLSFEFTSINEAYKDASFHLKDSNGLTLFAQFKYPFDSKLQPFVQTPDDQNLEVTVQIPESTSVVPVVNLTWPRNSIWEGILTQIKLPEWRVRETCTIPYIAQVSELLLAACEVLEQRKKLFKGLTEVFGAPLEYDTLQYLKICFLVEHNSVVFVLHLLCVDFPAKQPTLTLTSFVTLKKERLKTLSFASYPYSPRWTPEEFGKRVKNWLVENVGEVKFLADE